VASFSQPTFQLAHILQQPLHLVIQLSLLVRGPSRPLGIMPSVYQTGQSILNSYGGEHGDAYQPTEACSATN
jgi:hypothetical protein